MQFPTVTVLALALTSCAVNPPPVHAPKKPADHGFEVTVVQRTKKKVQGLPVSISIGDITGGQVLFQLLGTKGKPVIDTVSMEPGDSFPFEYKGKRLYVSLVKLRNFLIGDDFAVFHFGPKPMEEVRVIPVVGKGRPAPWAKSVSLGGVQNLWKVDEGLYRSAQPSGAGFISLNSFGIKTIVNLRTLHSDRPGIEGTSLGYVHLPMAAWAPNLGTLKKFLRVVRDPKQRPVLVHCKNGADRTGFVCAVYRIVEQGWSKEEAIREMKEGGFGYSPIWGNLVNFLRKLDVVALR